MLKLSLSEYYIQSANLPLELRYNTYQIHKLVYAV